MVLEVIDGPMEAAHSGRKHLHHPANPLQERRSEGTTTKEQKLGTQYITLALCFTFRYPTLEIMTLSFPNSSRSFDATRRAVRFWGYDSAMEASFFVTEDALKRVQPSMFFDQNGALEAFDINRTLIYATATKVYARGHRGSYDLVAKDF